MLLTTGLGLLAAAARTPQAAAAPSRPAPRAPANGTYLFHDELDERLTPRPRQVDHRPGPRNHGGPDLLGAARKRRPIPRRSPKRVPGQAVSGHVTRATKDGNTYYSGKIFGKWNGGIGHTWEARMKLDCLTPGCWPAWYLSNKNAVNGGEVDVLEWYGNGNWGPATAIHAKLNGGKHVSARIAVGPHMAHLATAVGRRRHAVLEGLRRRRRALLQRSRAHPAGLAVQ